MPEWLKGVDCKSTGESLHKFESYSAQKENVAQAHICWCCIGSLYFVGSWSVLSCFGGTARARTATDKVFTCAKRNGSVQGTQYLTQYPATVPAALKLLATLTSLYLAYY